MSRIGKESKPVTFEVERGHILSFARSVGDLNPKYMDEKHARKSKYGGIIAPPTFLTALSDWDWITNNIASVDSPAKNMVIGGNVIELYEPIRVGDRISVTSRLVDALVKKGKMGKMLILVSEHTYTNQFGDAVAKCQNTIIRY
jgi:acyl dehydratase